MNRNSIPQNTNSPDEESESNKKYLTRSEYINMTSSAMETWINNSLGSGDIDDLKAQALLTIIEAFKDYLIKTLPEKFREEEEA